MKRLKNINNYELLSTCKYKFSSIVCLRTRCSHLNVDRDVLTAYFIRRCYRLVTRHHNYVAWWSAWLVDFGRYKIFRQECPLLVHYDLYFSLNCCYVGMTKLYIAFHSFTCRQRCWRAKKGISRRDWTHEESGKTSECFEFSWLLDYDETSSAGHRVCSSWRPETMANTKEATGNIYNLLLTMFLDVIQWLVSYCNWAMVNKIETNIKHTITVKKLKKYH